MTAQDRVRQIRDVARRSGHLRLVVRDAAHPVGVVHVRDTLTAAPDTTAAELMRPVLTFPADAPVYEALATMREQRSHLALIHADGQLLGLVTMHDLLDRLLPAAGTST